MDIEAFHSLVIGYLSEADPAKAKSIATIDVADDLLASGFVDSHKFIDLCLAIEEKTGAVIDLGELDPEQFSTIVGLYAIVTQSAP